MMLVSFDDQQIHRPVSSNRFRLNRNADKKGEHENKNRASVIDAEHEVPQKS
jgi:hypothetical protein